MRVDHAGDDGATVQIDDAGSRSAECKRSALRADESHAATRDRHCFPERTTFIDGVNPRVGDDELRGRLLRRKHRRKQDEERSAQHGVV